MTIYLEDKKHAVEVHSKIDKDIAGINTTFRRYFTQVHFEMEKYTNKVNSSETNKKLCWSKYKIMLLKCIQKYKVIL